MKMGTTAAQRAWGLRSNRAIRLVLGSAVVLMSFGFLGYLVRQNWAIIIAYRWHVSYRPLAATFLLHLCAFLVAIWGWHRIIGRLAGMDNLRLNAKVYCYSALVRRLPGVAWDIATRLVMYDQVGVSKAIVGLASVLELVAIALSGMVVYVSALPFTLPPTHKVATWAPFLAIILAAVLTNPHIITRVVRRVRKGSLPVALRYRDTAQWLGIYALAWISGGLLLYATVRTIYALPSKNVLQLVADWSLAGVLTSFMTFVPSGLGLKEATLTVLMSRYMPQHIAIAAAILMRLLMTAYSILWALLATRL